MHVPLLDLTRQYQPLRDRMRAAIDEITDAQAFILGPKVEAFERAVCEYTGSMHAIGVSSGTDALLVILMALGIGPGDAVITTPYSFFATAGCIARVGARPLFVDIDPATFNLSVAKLRERLAKNDTPRIKAIMPVHLYGQSAAMDEITAIAAELGVPVIEDAAQALGAQYLSQNGAQHCGTIGEFGAYSFFPSKNLGAFGDAGMVLCRDDAMAAKIRALRNHGMENRYYHHMIGGNFRIDALQAAVLHIKLPHLDEWSRARQRNADFYREEFARAGLADLLQMPLESTPRDQLPFGHIYNQFVLRAPRRDELSAHLTSHHIGHAVYYPVPLHLQECFADLGHHTGDFPESERAAKETLALPIFPELSREQQGFVVETIRVFYA